jgi:hypothetical protein
MREDLTLATTARGLRQAGLAWHAQIGDWCVLLDGLTSADASGLWLVTAADPAVGWATVCDAAGQWPPARIALADALWLPTAGQLRAWLRAHGFRVATSETAPGSSSMESAPAVRQGWAAGVLGPSPASPPGYAMPHTCEATRDAIAIRATGVTEAEAAAEAVLRVLVGGR